MKKYLEEANTEKTSYDLENDKMACGISSMQGWRARQEVNMSVYNIIYYLLYYRYIHLKWYIVYRKPVLYNRD